MANTVPTVEMLSCGCTPEQPWPPRRVPDAPKPAIPPPPPSVPVPTPRYNLRGPQVDPEAAFWTICQVPCVIRIRDLVRRTDNPDNAECFIEPFPTNSDVLRDEIDELLELASLRDDPDALFSNQPRRERRAISPFLQLRPQPIGAVVNIERDPVLGAVLGGRRPEPGALDIARGDDVNPAFPVIRTGRELARYFEEEPPGLAHRLALNALLRRPTRMPPSREPLPLSPPRQALIWAALDITIYSAQLAAWYYKWAAHLGLPGVAPRPGISLRPRPIEMDHRVSVLYNRYVNATGSGDDGRRLLPDPSPGTPRHPAYPSGHSTYAAAASELLSFFFPDYTEEFDRLADNAGIARIWAGIHYRSDHVAGAKLGRCVARMVIEQIEASCICPEDPCVPPDYCARPPNDPELRRCRRATIECCSRHRALDEEERRVLDEDKPDQEAARQTEGRAEGSVEAV